MKYPQTLNIGSNQFRRRYDLQPDKYLLEFQLGVTDLQADEYLAQFDVGPLEIEQTIDEEVLSTKYKKMAWRPPQEMPDWYVPRRWVSAPNISIEELQNNPIVHRVAPIFFEAGKTAGSAVAPLPDILLLETIDGIPSDELIEEANQLGLTYNPAMSRWLRPFSYFERFDSDTPIYDLVQHMLTFEEVKTVEFNYRIYEGQTAAPTLDEQWNLKTIGAEEGWMIEEGGNHVTVGIIDTGGDASHYDLSFTDPSTHINAALLAQGFDAPHNTPPVNPHGTAVAGIAAAINNGVGITGVASHSKVLPAMWDQSSAGIAACINWCVVQEALVLNLSVRCPPNLILSAAVKNAHQASVVLVAAAGNFDEDELVFPAAYPEVIAVGAIGKDGRRAVVPGFGGWGSNYGPDLDVVAPGVEIHTTDMRGDPGYSAGAGLAGDYYKEFDRTSAAAPHVAGLAALILSHCPDLTNTQIRQIICESCAKLPDYFYANNGTHPYGSWNDETGYGLIQIDAALERCIELENEAEEMSEMETTTTTGDNGSSEATNPNPAVFDITQHDLFKGSLHIRFVDNDDHEIEADMVITWIPDDPAEATMREVVPIPSGGELGIGKYVACVRKEKTLKSVVSCIGEAT